MRITCTVVAVSVVMARGLQCMQSFAIRTAESYAFVKLTPYSFEPFPDSLRIFTKPSVCERTKSTVNRQLCDRHSKNLAACSVMLLKKMRFLTLRKLKK